MMSDSREKSLFKEQAIYFDNIKYGLDNYENEIIEMEEKEAFAFFQQKSMEAKTGSVYADFYYSRLAEDSKAIIDQELTEKEKTYIQNNMISDEIIYPLDEMLLGIITKLNAREILFSTIYFTGSREERSTWWGNYNQEYIVFREKEKNRQI